MSIHGLKPSFTDYNGYKTWRKQWAAVYMDVTKRIKVSKKRLRDLQQKDSAYERKFLAECATAKTAGATRPIYSNAFYSYRKQEEAKRDGLRVSAWKLMTVLEEAKIRMGNITAMRKTMNEHLASFPIVIEECDRVDFHFNKKHLEYSWIPMWVLKTKGKTFYVHHVNALCPWTTRETPDNDATKGSIRLRNCSLQIDAEGIATLSSLKETVAA